MMTDLAALLTAAEDGDIIVILVDCDICEDRATGLIPTEWEGVKKNVCARCLSDRLLQSQTELKRLSRQEAYAKRMASPTRIVENV